jgi:hypothetical protein
MTNADEARYNPLCRSRAWERGQGGAGDASEPRSLSGGAKAGHSDEDSGSDSSGSDFDIEAEVHRSRLARLRHERKMRGDIARQLETLEAIRCERLTRRAMDEELESVRRRMGKEGFYSQNTSRLRPSTLYTFRVLGHPALIRRVTLRKVLARETVAASQQQSTTAPTMAALPILLVCSRGFKTCQFFRLEVWKDRRLTGWWTCTSL